MCAFVATRSTRGFFQYLDKNEPKGLCRLVAMTVALQNRDFCQPPCFGAFLQTWNFATPGERRRKVFGRLHKCNQIRVVVSQQGSQAGRLMLERSLQASDDCSKKAAQRTEVGAKCILRHCPPQSDGSFPRQCRGRSSKT